MFDALRRLSLGFTLILVAAATLLLTDLGSRKNANNKPGVTKENTLRIALVQHSSIKAHDDGASLLKLSDRTSGARRHTRGQGLRTASRGHTLHIK